MRFSRRMDQGSNLALPRTELDALNEMAVLVAEGHEMPTLLQRVINRAAALVGVEEGFLYLTQPDGTLVLVAAVAC